MAYVISFQNNHCGASRGSGQRVYSFVYFSRRERAESGGKRRYFDGIALNAEIINELRSSMYRANQLQ